jgi:RNA polymerase sigma-70 factor (ECF subfamily)
VLATNSLATGGKVGELEAQLSDFFAAHYDRLVGLAGLICRSPATAEDAVQTALEQAWRNRNTLRNSELLKAWLDQIVVREAIRSNRNPWVSRLLPGAAKTMDAIADRTPAMNPAWISLIDAFRRLPAHQRAAVALHMYAGYSVEETAELTGSTFETTRSRLRLARARLRRELTED